MNHHPHNTNSRKTNTRKSPRQNNGRTSHSSISSLSAHESGGKMKARMSKKQSFTKSSLLGRVRVSGFHSAPIIPLSSHRRISKIKTSVGFVPAGQRRSSLTTSNEQWDTITEDLDRSSSTNDARAFVTKWTTTSKKSSHAAPKKKTKRVAFIAAIELIGTTSYAALPIGSVWYTSPTCDTFLENSLSSARVVRRLMKYASIVETSYNSSTGLVTATTLPTYLSNPQEVIGIESHLSGQQSARASLKSNHKRACLKDHHHLDLDGFTLHQDKLAARLADYSNISAYMARERASYSLNLSD